MSENDTKAETGTAGQVWGRRQDGTIGWFTPPLSTEERVTALETQVSDIDGALTAEVARLRARVEELDNQLAAR